VSKDEIFTVFVNHKTPPRNREAVSFESPCPRSSALRAGVSSSPVGSGLAFRSTKWKCRLVAAALIYWLLVYLVMLL